LNIIWVIMTKVSRQTITYLVSGPILAVFVFIVSYYTDPFDFKNQDVLSALPAFLFSVVVLFITHLISTDTEVRKTTSLSADVYTAVKNHMHVVVLGSPEKALDYIERNISDLREVLNTSFNTQTEKERANEKFYDTNGYASLTKAIANNIKRSNSIKQKLVWKDIGDSLAKERFLSIKSECAKIANKAIPEGYKIKFIAHDEPQINFIILEYLDGEKEVLFNWDFRSNGQDPLVMLSKESKIVEMFAVQYNLLWENGVEDYDNIITRSTS
ncbi:hypothetical protein, partial [Pseudoalteromonas sp. BMB]|uniref:hypothetical protein n=1 Tax=Pseudoalteromonas sp. BMB TaxID=1874619 RepID=UPI000A83A4E6